MTAQITTLIDKRDNLEIVRDQIAGILIEESEKQHQLATQQGKDSALWKLRVFTDSANPIEDWITTPDAELEDTSPIVNIWPENGNFDMKGGNVVERQRLSMTFNVDCYGYGVSAQTSGGHKPGDQEAALEVQRAYRLVRNILMAGHYVYLGLQGTVGRRWPQSVTFFQPQIGDRPVQRVNGARLALQVDFNEFSPQVQGQPLEGIFTQVKRASTGQVYLEQTVEFDVDS